jgi:uncharacterized protein
MSRPIVICQTLHFYLPGVASLKDKRSIVKSMLERSRRHFNVASAEIDRHDVHQTAVLAFTTVSNSVRHNQEQIDSLVRWLETHFPDAIITNQSTEIL